MFNDLSFRSTGNNIQIQAITNDYSDAVSNKIKVLEADIGADPNKPFIKNLFCSRITRILLGNSFIVIVTEDSNISMIDLKGNELFNTDLNLPLKFIRISGNILTFGDWNGNVYIQTSDKKSFSHHFLPEQMFIPFLQMLFLILKMF
ncbi:MAG: hypothetical protein HC906_12280 [Bacteroidales bacterium]|nr:hypothetical protein [Bacteroidales bacterium]